jgi:hypothetical protein
VNISELAKLLDADLEKVLSFLTRSQFLSEDFREALNAQFSWGTSLFDIEVQDSRIDEVRRAWTEHAAKEVEDEMKEKRR